MAELPESLGTEAEALLAAYRVHRGPPLGMEARMLASMHAQLGLVPGTGGGASAGAKTATSGTATTGTATTVGAGVVSGKLIALASTLALTVASGAGVLASRSPSEASAPGAVPIAEIEAPASLLEQPSEPPDVKDLVLEPELADEESPIEAESGAAGRGRQARLRRKPGRPRSSGGLAEEAKLLRSADSALRRGALGEAQDLLERHRSGFKAGELGQQARALELLLACAQGQPGASQAAVDHLEAQPSARARARIERECGID